MTKAYHTVPAEDVLASFSPDRRKKIDARAAELIAEEFALRELREAKQMTQEQVAEKLGGRQVYVSRLEKRADMKLSTLREYVGAIGGTLELVVSFPKGRRVRLTEIGSATSADRSTKKRPMAARKRSSRKVSKQPA
jgi:transcriptional regulator with XRE-family HTH domain